MIWFLFSLSVFSAPTQPKSNVSFDMISDKAKHINFLHRGMIDSSTLHYDIQLCGAIRRESFAFFRDRRPTG